jgi:hypothetical protein
MQRLTQLRPVPEDEFGEKKASVLTSSILDELNLA